MAYSTTCCYLMVTLTFLVELSGGSRIVLTATPSDVADGETHLLRLSCSLQDTHSGPTVQDGNEYSATSYNIHHVDSIVIGKGQEEIAKIVYGQPPEAGSQETGATVTGNLTDDSDNQNYLDVTWAVPVLDYSGRYCCKLVAPDPYGATVFLKSCIIVDFAGPLIQDLISRMTVLNDTLVESNRVYLKTISEMNTTINALERTIKTLKPQHVEQGITGFGMSSDWKTVFSTSREYVVNVSFRAPYNNPPIVNVAVVYIDADHKFNTRYMVEVRNLTTRGFHIACQTWWDSILYRVEIRWTSIGT